MKRLVVNLIGLLTLGVPSARWIIDIIGLASFPEDLRTWGIVVGTMLEDPWLVIPAIVGLSIIVFANIPAARIWERFQFSGGASDSNELIPLQEAARTLYSLARKKNTLAAAASEWGDTEDGVLDWWGGYIAVTKETPLYGSRPPSTEREQIDVVEVCSMHIEGGATELKSAYSNSGRYVDLEVRRSDLSALRQAMEEGENEAKEAGEPQILRMPITDLKSEAINQGWEIESETGLHLLDLCDGLRQAGLDGTVQFWGKLDEGLFEDIIRREPLDKISNEHWRDYEIDATGWLQAESNFDVRTYNTKRANWGDNRYIDLHVDKAQVLHWLKHDALQYRGRNN